jgi:hypothetical protein
LPDTASTNGGKSSSRVSSAERSIEQRSRWHGFDDQFISLFAHDRVIARQLERTGYSNRLVSAIFEKFDMSFRRQNSYLVREVGMCLAYADQ